MFFKRYLSPENDQGTGDSSTGNNSGGAAGTTDAGSGEAGASDAGKTAVEPDFDGLLEKKTGGKVKKWEEVETKLTDYEAKTKELDEFKTRFNNRPAELVKFEKIIEAGTDISTFVKAANLDPESTDQLYLLKEGMKIAGKSEEAITAKIKGFQKFLSNEKMEQMQTLLDEGKIEKYQFDDFKEEHEIKKAELAAEVKDAKVSIAKFKQEYSLEYIDKAREEHVNKTNQQKEASKKEWDQNVDSVVKDLTSIETEILVGDAKFDYKLTDTQKEDLLVKLRAANSLGIPKEAMKDYGKGIVWAQYGPDITKAAIERAVSAENLKFAKLLEGKVDKPGGAGKNVSHKTDTKNSGLAEQVIRNNRM